MKLNLPSRPTHTLLYVGPEKTVRVDAGKHGELWGDFLAVDTPCESVNELPRALEAVIATGPKLGRRTWILYHGITTHELSLPTVQTAGVGPEILVQALRFEFEALTGQATANTHLAYSLLGDEDEMSHFWVSLIPIENFKRIQAVLHKGRSRLGGIVHPGGVPVLLSGEEVRDWIRIEYWPETILTLHSSPKTGLGVQMFRNSHQPGGWSDEMQRWRNSVGDVNKTEALLTGALEFTREVDENIRLDQHEVLFTWLSAWAHELTETEERKVPVLKVPDRGNKELTLTAGIAAGVLLVCALHFGWFTLQAMRNKSEAEALKATEQTMKSTREAINKIRDKKDKLQKDLDLLKGDSSLIPEVVEALLARPARLLKALADRRSEEIVIEAIGVSGDTVSVDGVALDPTLPNELAASLEKDLTALGWQLNPPNKKDMELFPAGGPWSFTLKFLDAGIDGFKKDQSAAAAQSKAVP